MKEFFKSGKNIAILVLAIVLAGSVACNICLATRRCAPRGPHGHHIEQFHNNQGGPQGQMPQGNDQNNQAQPPQGQPPQAPPNGQEPNSQAPQDGQQGQKKDSDKKGNNDDKKDSEDDDDKEEDKKQ